MFQETLNNMYDYELLERKLLSIVSSFENILPLGEVKELIYYTEYGEAYDLLCAILRQENVSISQDTYAQIVELGQLMELEESVWLKLQPIK
jgi:hypothetical protein